MAAKKLEDMSLEEYQAAQVEEWNAYTATSPIYIGGALAFREGDRVPAGHVKNGVVDKSQVKAIPAAEKES